MRDVFDMPALLETLRAIRKRDAARARRRHAHAFPFRLVAALQLRGQLHLRRRCAAGRAPRAGALDRSGAVARPAGRRRPARAARRRCRSPKWRSSFRACGRRSACAPPTASTTCCCVLAICRARRSLRAARGSGAGRSAGAAAARAPRCSKSRSPEQKRLIAVEDAARYRDALGIPLPPGLRARAAAAGGGAGARTGSPLRPHARSFYPARDHLALWARCAAGRERFAALLLAAALSKEDSVPAASTANGATPRCCA